MSDEADKLPPHSDEAEEGILGCLLLDPLGAIPKCIGLLKPGAASFYSLKTRTVYETIINLWDKNKAVDLITVRNEIPTMELGYLSSLPDKVPSAENLEYYTEIVVDKYALRKAIIESVNVIDQARKEPHNVQDLIAGAAAALESITNQTSKESEISTPKKLIPDALGHIEDLLINAGKVTGISAGLVDLDHITWGFQPAEMCVIAARPSVGKTALAVNIAEYVAVDLKKPVAFFSIEMTSHALMVRMLCSRARVSTKDVREGKISQQQQEKLFYVSQEFLNAPIYIDDSSELSILELKSKAKRMINQYGIQLIIIDYLQLLKASHRQGENRQQEVTYISKGIKALNKETKVPIIAIAQLNRKLDDRGANSKPKLSDLRESGSIEQDSDVVIMLHRPKDDGQEENLYGDTIQVRADVAKNRNGPTGEVDLIFRRSCTRFESKAKAKAQNIIDLPPQEPDTLL